ncbi:MAG: nitrophenyl compound nitroreductase subunit ArsF family protein, partial [Bacteroidota bacterium]
VFYFHYTRRCATCNAVEDVAKEAIEEFYGDDVLFVSYNLDEADGKEKAEETGISGQTLIIVSGENKMNITNEGFMNARTNPEKLKQIIKEKIDSLQ